ncbi:MAG: holocytochrome c synthase [Pleopsidium flavum]|nr:MAG: holocytochrome c synthase [Pleopsidium flavum]
MGWFWADTAKPVVQSGLHSYPEADATPPPGSPMHAATSSPPTYPPQGSALPPSDGSCPMKAPNTPLDSSDQTPKLTLSKLNPLNYMPSDISQKRTEHQTVNLPVERTVSSIPKGDASGNWEYPSPQQMYNAMLRKGYDDTPEDAVESMVAVHNFLNEGAWAEIVEWERRFAKGLGRAWQECKRGEEGPSSAVGMQSNEDEDVVPPRLVKFMGRPDKRTPKASMLQIMGLIWPKTYGGEPPFDRHDWYIQRQTSRGKIREVRYVIDYYSAPPEPTGEPVFYLDVRPAVDGPTAALERMMRWGGDVWYKASGAAVRENTPR